MHDVTRRSLLNHGIAITGLTALSPYAASAVLTPRTTERPFLLPRQSMRFDDVDNDLVKVLGTLKEAGGDIIHLQGTIRSKAGRPLAGHRIEIWQCNVNGSIFTLVITLIFLTIRASKVLDIILQTPKEPNISEPLNRLPILVALLTYM